MRSFQAKENPRRENRLTKLQVDGLFESRDKNPVSEIFAYAKFSGTGCGDKKLASHVEKNVPTPHGRVPSCAMSKSRARPAMTE